MSQVTESYFVKALHDAKIEELRTNYVNRGYIPDESAYQEKGSFDLVLRNAANGRVVAFEVKMLPISSRASDQIKALKDKAIQLGYDFRLVTIARPKKYEIAIDWLDQALLDYLIEAPLQEIEDLATHVTYENVEASVVSLSISEDQAKAQVQGLIDVEFQYGSGSDLERDIGMTAGYSFPFEGELDLDIPSQSITGANLKPDLSEWDAEIDEE